LQRLTDADVSETGHRFFQARSVYVGEVPVTAMRLSYVGELGWELYTSADHGLRLWDLLWEAGQDFGVIAGGRGAFDSLRVEKGYRFWGRDMWTEHDPYEAGVGFAVNLDKGDFVGREALLRRRQEGPRQRLVCLSLGPEDVVMGSEPVYAGDRPVGFVTSAAYGYSLGHGVVYAWVRPEWAEAGTPLAVEYFGERLPATVTPEPLFDPEMLRMRVPSAPARVRVPST
jgi:glycine cleavage system aminomethyltransferase T